MRLTGRNYKSVGGFGATLGFGLLVSLIIIFMSGASAKPLVVASGVLGGFIFWTFTCHFKGVLSSVTLVGLATSLTLVIQYHFAHQSDHFGGAIGYRVSLTLLIILLLMLMELWHRPAYWNDFFSFDKVIGTIFFIYLLSGVFSTFASDHYSLGLYQISAYMEAFFVFVFLSTYLNCRKRIYLFLSGIFIAIVLQGALGIAQARWPGKFDLTFLGSGEVVEKTVSRGNVSLVDVDTGTTMLGGELVERPTGSLIHPNIFSLFFVLSLPMVVAIWLATKRKLLIWGTSALILIGVASLYVSLSRVAWVCCAFIIMLGLIRFRKITTMPIGPLRKGMIVIFCMIVLTGIAWKADTIYLRMTENTHEAVDFRTNLMRTGYLMFLDYPLTGVGLNSSIKYIERYDSGYGSRIKLYPIHNLYLMEFCESGVFGFASFLCLVYTICMRCWRQSFRCRSASLRYLAIFSTFSLIAFWVAELSGFTYRIPAVTNLFWAQAGFILAVIRVDMEESRLA